MLAPNVVLAALAVGVGTAHADGAAIVDAISGIQNATLALGSTVGSWDGGVLGALPIIAESTALLATIGEGTAAAGRSAGLSDAEGLAVGLSTLALVGSVNASLAAIAAAKPKFDASLLSPVVLLNLELEKGASAGFSDAVIGKLPASLVATGQALAGEITASFDEAIGLYKGGVL